MRIHGRADLKIVRADAFRTWRDSWEWRRPVEPEYTKLHMYTKLHTEGLVQNRGAVDLAFPGGAMHFGFREFEESQEFEESRGSGADPSCGLCIFREADADWDGRMSRPRHAFRSGRIRRAGVDLVISGAWCGSKLQGSGASFGSLVRIGIRGSDANQALQILEIGAFRGAVQWNRRLARNRVMGIDATGDPATARPDADWDGPSQ